MTIQIKQLEPQKETTCNNICRHHFADTNDDTKCRFCNKTVKEAFNEWLDQNQKKIKEEK